MDLYPKNKLPIAEVKKFILIFYTVAIIGFLIPFTKDLFISITPFAIILCAYLLAIYHETYTKKDVFTFILVFVLGFFVEVIGVNTGLIFGIYNYGSALGLKLFNTPLLIGINWLFLTYTSISIAKSLKIKEGLIVFIAPLSMLVFDFILEQVAPNMDMWYWQNSIIPIKNYITWYLIGVCFVLLFKVFKIETKHPLAAILFTFQFVFFIFLTFLLK